MDSFLRAMKSRFFWLPFPFSCDIIGPLFGETGANPVRARRRVALFFAVLPGSRIPGTGHWLSAEKAGGKLTPSRNIRQHPSRLQAAKPAEGEFNIKERCKNEA